MTEKNQGRPRVRELRTSTAATELIALQKRLGLSNYNMSVYLGVPLPTYRNWRDGHREPPSVLRRLLDVLGTIEALAPALHDEMVPGRK